MILKYTLCIQILILFGHEAKIIDPKFVKCLLTQAFIRASDLFKFI